MLQTPQGDHTDVSENESDDTVAASKSGKNMRTMANQEDQDMEEL